MLNTRTEEEKTGFCSYLACFCDYSHLEYVRIHATYRVDQAEYGINILVVAPQEYVKIYLTCRVRTTHMSFCRQRVNPQMLSKSRKLTLARLALSPPKPASLRDAGFAARVVVLGCGFSCARVWIFEDFD